MRPKSEDTFTKGMFVAMNIYVLDRFEGSFAVLEDSQGTMNNVPKEMLPQNLKEGDVLKEAAGVYSFDAAATSERAERIKSLMKDIFN
jgi:hypothetical protein